MGETRRKRRLLFLIMAILMVFIPGNSFISRAEGEPVDIAAIAAVTAIPDQAYTGSEITPEIEVKTTEDVALTKDTDYEVTFSDNIQVGTATVTVTGKGAYTGTLTATFRIKKSIAECPCFINDNSIQKYTGEEIKPPVAAREKGYGEYLTEGTDFTVSYSDNVNVGKATVTFTGIGDYMDTNTAEFQIVDPKSIDYAIPSVNYVKVDSIPLKDGTVTDGFAKFTVGFSIDPSVDEAEFFSTVTTSDGQMSGLTAGPLTTLRPTGSPDDPSGVTWVPATADGEHCYTYSFEMATGDGTDEPQAVYEEGSFTYLNFGMEGDVVNVYAEGVAEIPDVGGVLTDDSNSIAVPLTASSIGQTFRATSTASLEDAVIATIPDQTFTGDPIEPKLTVSLDGKTLTEGDDYTVTYTNNVNVTWNYHSTYATVTGTGDYEGTTIQYFNIVGSGAVPATVANASVKVESFKSGSLKNIVTEALAGDVATLSVTFDKQKGIKRYFVCAFNSRDSKAISGTLPHLVVVNDKKAYWESFDGKPVYTGPNGETITQTGTTVTVTTMVVNPADKTSSWYESMGFAEGENMTVMVEALSDDEMTSSSPVNIQIPFAASSAGKTYTKDGVVTNPVSLEKATVTKVPDQTYTGKAITPKLTVTAGDLILVQGTDFDVAYKNNTNAGTATAVLTAKGDKCTGSRTVTFKINPASLSGSDVTVDPLKAFAYTGKPLTPALILKRGGTTLKNGTDYSVKYTNNTNAGPATAELIGKGNYKDSTTTTFNINPMSVTPTIKLSKTSFVYNGKTQTPTVKVTVGGITLKQNTDYTVTYTSGRKNAGTYKVTVKLKGNYKGSGCKSFKITKAANKLKVTAKKATASLKQVKKAAVKIPKSKAYNVTKANGVVTYKKTKGNSAFTVNKQTGAITVKKGTRKGTYKVNVNVKAAGTKNYMAVTKSVQIKITVK